MSEPNYTDYYNLEKYVRSNVFETFHKIGFIGAMDFFCIVIWKANRAKSKIAKKLRKIEPDLETCCTALTKLLFQAQSNRERLRLMLENYKFRLPMATAILSILYPDDFMIYDYRVCEALGDFCYLSNVTDFDQIFAGYNKYLQAAISVTAPELSLTEKDHYLWGKSFYLQLQSDLESSFGLIEGVPQ